MIAPLLSTRTERTTTGRGTTAAPRVAAAHQAFDDEAAERAEILREHEVLQLLLMEFLKNEDEIMKKWIALI
ncbi:MAG TPA: hypothetical protein VMU38_04290 [Candidatus Binatia bacterium]|nr:hypothetical protein [Candidatus Binatia bacterium]